MASSNVVDLGTEFGVKIDEAGVAEVHVLAGKVAVQLGPKSDAIEKQIELTAGSAGRIPPAGRSMQEIRIRADQFAELRPLLDQNLIVNGDFETGAEHGVVVRDENQRTTITDTVISGWDDQTKATKLLYEQPSDGGDFVRPGEHPVPPDHGRFFYIGGEEGTTSQRIDVAQLAEFTDEGVIKCTVSGWLGGFEDQNDTLAMKAIALGDRAEELDTVQLGPVSVTDRGSKTCLLHKFGSMVLPRGTRSVRVELISTSDTTSKFSGNIPDAYCDNLSLVLTRTGGK